VQELTPDAVAAPSPVAARPGAVILVRHGKPDVSRLTLLSPEGYRRWWGAYEEIGLKPGQAAPESVRAAARAAGAILASTRPRSVQTARAASEGRDFTSDPRLIEAPLPPPPWPAWVRLPPMAWGFFSRLCWWFFDHHAGEESRAEAEARAEAMTSDLIGRAAAGADVLVLAHGFFNAMIGRALVRRGWRCADDGGYAYWALRRFEGPTAPHHA
jgi:broad specificity phosphatase PhoE